MALNSLTQDEDLPYSNHFFSGTLPTPTGKIANFLNLQFKEDQQTAAAL